MASAPRASAAAIADDLRSKITSCVYPVGAELPGISASSTDSCASSDVTAALTQARDTLTTALAALAAQAKHTVTFDLLARG